MMLESKNGLNILISIKEAFYTSCQVTKEYKWLVWTRSSSTLLILRPGCQNSTTRWIITWDVRKWCLVQESIIASPTWLIKMDSISIGESSTMRSKLRLFTKITTGADLLSCIHMIVFWYQKGMRFIFTMLRTTNLSSQSRLKLKNQSQESHSKCLQLF